MQYVLDSREMKAVDKRTIEEIGIPSLVLMERAALSVVEQIEKKAQKEDKILCLCGMGNNGGDGIAVARMLHQKGYIVFGQMVGNMEKMSQETRQQYEIAKNIGVSFVNSECVEEYTIIVDALFGIGLSRDVSGIYAQWIEKINAVQSKVFAVDIPSGICTDTGAVKGCAVRADVTVTFGYPKVGLLMFPGCEYAGEVIVSDIGFSELKQTGIPKVAFEPADVKARLPKRWGDSNKGSYGKVLIIAGSKNMAGACYLSAKAAYYMGAGLVKVITVEENRTIIQEKIPEAVLLTYESGNVDFYLEQIKQEILGARAIVVGPGMGKGEDAKKILSLVMENAKVPTVVDADALTLLAEETTYIEKYKKDSGNCVWNLQENMILTPHIKEMSVLLGGEISVKEIKKNIFSIVNACKDNKNVLVLKDARTIVMQKEHCYINTSGNNGMATAGSGDVLTGIIVGLLGQGMAPYDAAMLGTYIHGLAGDASAEEKGRYSLMAQDIILALPKILVH